MYTDPIADFLTRLRNAQAARLETVQLPSSIMKFTIAKILEREGYVANVSEEADGVKKTLTVTLKYDGKEPAIHEIDRISTPGRRVYAPANRLPRVLSDLGIAIISTSAGLMTNKDARRRKLGGEVICTIN